LLALGNDQLFSVCLYCYRLFDISSYFGESRPVKRDIVSHLEFLGLSVSMPSNSTFSSSFRERLVYLHIFVLVCWSFLVVEEEKMGLDERVWCYKAQVLPTLRVSRLCHVPSSTLCTADDVLPMPTFVCTDYFLHVFIFISACNTVLISSWIQIRLNRHGTFLLSETSH
jgi:hypothetical protein